MNLLTTVDSAMVYITLNSYYFFSIGSRCQYNVTFGFTLLLKAESQTIFLTFLNNT